MSTLTGIANTGGSTLTGLDQVLTTLQQQFTTGPTEITQVEATDVTTLTLEVTSTADSTSTTTGAAKVAGGLGVAKTLHVGAQDPAVAIPSSGGESLVCNGPLLIKNGANYNYNMVAAFDSSMGNGTYRLFSFGKGQGTNQCIELAYNIAANSTTTMSLGFWGGSTGLIMTPNGSNSDVNFPNTTASTSTTTGALTAAGGAGIAGAVNAGGPIKTTDTTASSSTTTGSLLAGGGAGIAGAVNAGGPIKTTDSTVSSSTTTGSLVTPGGAGIGGQLHVGADINLTAPGLIYWDPNNNVASWQIYTDHTSFALTVGQGGTPFTNTMTSTGWSTPSDAVLKENIRPLDQGLEAICRLKPVRYDWKNAEGKGIPGLIAQEVREVVPEAVYEHEDGKLGLTHNLLLPVLIKAVQELAAWQAGRDVERVANEELARQTEAEMAHPGSARKRRKTKQ